MPSKIGSLTLGLGMTQIPLGMAKASTTDVPDLSSVCECGGKCGYHADADGNKVECKECGETYSWWNSVPSKAFELGDELVTLDPDTVEEARESTPVPTGEIEKVVPVKRVLLHYAVEGNYYLLPEEDFADQYGALVATLNEQDWAMLTYVQLRTKTRRYAVVSEGGVLLALELADKKALPELEYGTDEAMEQQAASMLSGMVTDDPELEDVEGQTLKEAVRAQVEAAPEPEIEEPDPEEIVATDGGPEADEADDSDGEAGFAVVHKHGAAEHYEEIDGDREAAEKRAAELGEGYEVLPVAEAAEPDDGGESDQQSGQVTLAEV